MEPCQAVAAALAVESGGMERLDRYLVQHVLHFLLDRRGDGQALGMALVDAVDGLRHADGHPWVERWRVLLELVREARRAPSAARDLELARPSGRSAEVLRALSCTTRPLQPSELAEKIRIARPQVSKLLADLDASDLVHRQRVGREVWVVLTPRGQRLAALIAPTGDVAQEEASAPRMNSWWNVGASPELRS